MSLKCSQIFLVVFVLVLNSCSHTARQKAYLDRLSQHIQETHATELSCENYRHELLKVAQLTSKDGETNFVSDEIAKMTLQKLGQVPMRSPLVNDVFRDASEFKPTEQDADRFLKILETLPKPCAQIDVSYLYSLLFTNTKLVGVPSVPFRDTLAIYFKQELSRSMALEDLLALLRFASMVNAQPFMAPVAQLKIWQSGLDSANRIESKRQAAIYAHVKALKDRVEIARLALKDSLALQKSLRESLFP